MRECSIHMNFKGEDDFFDPIRAKQYSELIKN